MIPTPYRFEAGFTATEFEKIGQLALRWSAIEHITTNCLKQMLRLSDEEAIVTIFPLPLERKLNQMTELAAINPITPDATMGLNELNKIMRALQYVRNSVIHSIVIEETSGDHLFHLRSKRRSLTKQQVFSTEELTNYAAHVVIFLRYALGGKTIVGEPTPLPDRPDIPEFLLQEFPALLTPRTA